MLNECSIDLVVSDFEEELYWGFAQYSNPGLGPSDIEK